MEEHFSPFPNLHVGCKSINTENHLLPQIPTFSASSQHMKWDPYNHVTPQPLTACLKSKLAKKKKVQISTKLHHFQVYRRSFEHTFTGSQWERDERVNPHKWEPIKM